MSLVKFRLVLPVEPPVKEDEELDVTITDISHRGDSGIAKVNGFVIFVPGARPGDKVHVRISKVTARHATARAVEADES